MTAFFVPIQILIIPLILAAHKHYSVDIFTALYVTPLVFEFLSRQLPDLDSTTESMAKHYGLVIRPTVKGHYLVFMWRNDFVIDALDVPLDLKERIPVDLFSSQDVGL